MRHRDRPGRGRQACARLQGSCRRRGCAQAFRSRGRLRMPVRFQSYEDNEGNEGRAVALANLARLSRKDRGGLQSTMLPRFSARSRLLHKGNEDASTLRQAARKAANLERKTAELAEIEAGLEEMVREGLEAAVIGGPRSVSAAQEASAGWVERFVACNEISFAHLLSSSFVFDWQAPPPGHTRSSPLPFLAISLVTWAHGSGRCGRHRGGPRGGGRRRRSGAGPGTLGARSTGS